MTEQLPIPLSRADCYLATAAGMTGVILPANGPQSREEDYLAYMAGDTTIVLPTPGPLKEQWLAIICGDTSVTTPEIKGAFLIGQQMVRVEFLAKAAGVDGVVLPTNPNRTEQYFANIGGIVPDPGVLTQAKGTYIVLNNVLRGIDSLNYIYGNTTQQTYSGKNLFNFNNGTLAFYGNTAHSNTDNSVTMTASGTTGAQYSRVTFSGLDATKNYTISGKAKKLVAGSDGSPFLRVSRQYSDDGITWTGFANIYTTNEPVEGTEYSFNETVTGHAYWRFLFYNNGAGTVTVGESSTYYDIQLEQSDKPTAYEPYCGGIPSPNPDYPQDIQLVTGEQTITISDGTNSEDYKVHLTSKNICDFANITYKSYYLCTYNKTNDSLSITTTSANKYASVNYNTIWCETGKTYTVSMKATIPNISGAEPNARFGKNNNGTSNIIGTGTSTLVGNEYVVTFTFTADSDFDLNVTFYPSANVGNENVTSTFTKFQIEEGDQTTTYQPYYNYELAKIGSYQDYIYKSGDDWYAHKEIGKVVLDGTESWGGGGSIFQTSASTTPNKGSVSAVSYSNYFTWAYYPSSISTIIKNGEFGWNSAFALTMRNDNITGPANFKTWLSTNNVSIYYNLATPTDTKITDATLISELEAVGSAILPTPDAFIQVTGNLAGEIEISYYAKSEE